MHCVDQSDLYPAVVRVVRMQCMGINIDVREWRHGNQRVLNLNKICGLPLVAALRAVPYPSVCLSVCPVSTVYLKTGDRTTLKLSGQFSHMKSSWQNNF